ncbi:glycosyltransferase [Alicyclobacillus sp. SO9]|uniref:MGDG synthase family glycosyltransferase n=1 Tax=Alicyclobacillus sp. SO9 TaxID=2665646 RepID=UPI0018E80FDD|nr:glycosyltransferase [Alicyclobacillus sp. SO9]QQE77154.1 glycosyltransferase [Alicyclobacillus sp. SO9]
MKVLLLTASFGDGHNQAAFAAAEALKKRNIKVRVVDYTEWLNPALRSFAKFSLIQGVQRAPVLYGLFYRSMSKLQSTSSLQRQLNHLGMAQMKRYLRAYEPSVVASTFPTPTGVMSELREQGFTRVPSAAILTDYTAHGQWLQDHTDLYCTPTDAVACELEAHSVPQERLAVTGIPIRSQFSPQNSAAMLRKRVSHRRDEHFRSDKPLVLVMGGGSGLLGDVAEWMDVMEHVNLQFCVICGRNERLYRRLQPLESNRVRILGYTNEVDKWMAMADLIVTKPGGITVTEALAMELPMLLLKPIPGQEEQNAAFALHAGVARLASDVKAAGEFLQGLTVAPETLSNMRAATRRMSVRGAADTIADLLVDLGEQYESRQDKGAWAT